MGCLMFYCAALPFCVLPVVLLYIWSLHAQHKRDKIYNLCNLKTAETQQALWNYSTTWTLNVASDKMISSQMYFFHEIAYHL